MKKILTPEDNPLRYMESAQNNMLAEQVFLLHNIYGVMLEIYKHLNKEELLTIKETIFGLFADEPLGIEQISDKIKENNLIFSGIQLTTSLGILATEGKIVPEGKTFKRV